MAFKNHYLWQNNIGNMAATGEHKLINATYRREGRHQDLERYATLHKEQQTILEGLRSMDMQGWMRVARQGTSLQESRQLINKPDVRLNRETHGSSGRRDTFSNQNTTRYIRAIRTSRVGSLTFNCKSSCELDSHADTYVLGKHAHSFMNHEQSVDIVGHDKSKGHLQATL